MVARFTAGAMGIPFMPVRSLLGSDVVGKEALTPEARAADPRTAAKKAHVMDSPFDPADRVVLVPAIHTEFAVLHVQKATATGMVRIEGQSYADIQQALCADMVIVTAEDIVEDDVLRRTPELNPIPFFVVKHVCHVPFGAHPYAVYNYYDYDPLQLKEYHDGARDDAAYRAYLDTYVYGTRDHRAYLEAVGGAGRLDGLKASAKFGYSPDLKRRL